MSHRKNQIKKFTSPKTIKSRYIAVATLLILTMLLSMRGLFTDFIPTSQVKWVGFVLSILLLVFTLITGRGLTIFKPRFSNVILKKIEQIFGCALLWFIYWVSATHAVPSLYTQAFGTPHTSSEIVTPYWQPSSRECDYKIKNSYIKGTARGFICINEHWYKLKEKEYLLYGYQSPLGFYIRGVAPVNDLKQFIDSVIN